MQSRSGQHTVATGGLSTDKADSMTKMFEVCLEQLRYMNIFFNFNFMSSKHRSRRISNENLVSELRCALSVTYTPGS